MCPTTYTSCLELCSQCGVMSEQQWSTDWTGLLCIANNNYNTHTCMRTLHSCQQLASLGEYSTVLGVVGWEEWMTSHKTQNYPQKKQISAYFCQLSSSPCFCVFFSTPTRFQSLKPVAQLRDKLGCDFGNNSVGS